MYSLSPSSEEVGGDLELSDLSELGCGVALVGATFGVNMLLA